MFEHMDYLNRLKLFAKIEILLFLCGSKKKKNDAPMWGALEIASQLFPTEAS